MVKPSSDKVRKKNNQKLDLSNERFKEVSNSEYKKFEMLPNWLDNVSYRYEEEIQNNFPNGYYHFKRGSIIRVDFGVNMGSEFSFPHFAVVLDKKDNSKKRTLTVVPLTSKDKPGRLPLGKEIFKQTVKILNQKLESNRQRTRENTEKINHSRIGFYKMIKMLVDDLISQDKNYESEFSHFLMNKDVTIDEISETSQRVFEINNLDLNIFLKPIDIKMLQELVIEINNNSNSLKATTKELNDYDQVLSIYKNFNKNSFARVSDITTISKFRIKRINKTDPSGQIHLDDSKMKLISDKIMELYVTK